jgi:hypothetical protein
MAYSTGTANSAAEIVAAIKSLATGNGWSESGTTLIKGDIYTDLSTSGNNVFIRGALGGVGTNQSQRESRLRADAWTGTNNIAMLTFPCTYHVFVNTDPDDVVCFVNYNVNWWQWIMFGKAKNMGVDGTCNYQAGSFPAGANSLAIPWSTTADGSLYSTSPFVYGVPFPFWQPNSPAVTAPTGDSINVESTTWLECTNIPSSHAINARRFAKTFLNLMPNAWNGEITLCRVLLKYLRSTGVYSYAAELPHIRYTRNDNYTDGEIITLGSDEWMIFPGLRKDFSQRDGSTSNAESIALNSSGTVAIAVRKTT